MAFKMKGNPMKRNFKVGTPKKQTTYDPDIIGNVDQAMDYQKYYGQTKPGSGPDTDKRVIVGEEEFNYLMSQPGNEEFKKRLAANYSGAREGERMVYEQYGYEDRGGDEHPDYVTQFGKRVKHGSEYTYQTPGEGPRGPASGSLQKFTGSGGKRDFDKWVRSGVSRFNMPKLKTKELKSITPREEIKLPPRTGGMPPSPPRGPGLTGTAEVDWSQASSSGKTPKGPSNFGEAFKGARKEGKDIFEWKGRQYHTRRADETKKEWQEKFKTTKKSPGKEPKAKVAKKKTKVTKKKKDKKKVTEFLSTQGRKL